MKKFILILVTAILILGCSTDEKICCTNIDTGVSIKYVNDDGENLFESDNGFTTAEINIFHKIDNEWVRYYQGNLDHPKGISTVEREDGTYLVVFPSPNIIKDKYSETKIEFSEFDSDILKTEINRSNSSEIVTKVWYNDELKWQANQTERMFEILK